MYVPEILDAEPLCVLTSHHPDSRMEDTLLTGLWEGEKGLVKWEAIPSPNRHRCVLITFRGACSTSPSDAFQVLTRILDNISGAFEWFESQKPLGLDLSGTHTGTRVFYSPRAEEGTS